MTGKGKRESKFEEHPETCKLKTVYEKPTLTEIDLLDESAQGWSEPLPPGGGGGDGGDGGPDWP